ncbi:PQ loop repeat domain-containing protein [Hirsutella rhossiliensis]|uniref:PQ loop repeat domain-containing protein n=1 Tax=Hirsutella rhossiliensis TaxID=111463 RepID=A0A9P8SIE3_9HYPO|nr:PQ loop repeat domain-containing protein [Hirsutella rhossiliensis]KAH0964113.1 PQ loop repeat domain-containing protein [Hirsutella rhossiliensis]
MASLVAAALDVAARQVPVGQTLSGIFGSISLTAWICLLLPQLWANYKAKSADGLSLTFLVVWSLGDVSNLSGAILTNLAPSAVALAVYFCILDVTLISQCLYYNTINARRLAREEGTDTTGTTSENSPLLAGRRSSSRKTISDDEETSYKSGSCAYNALSLLAVYAIGVAGWFISYMAGAWDSDAPSVPESPGDPQSPSAVAGLALGYASAAFYLCARIPQIVKNYREKSCEGLSLLFFMLSLTGNLTYGVSLMAYCQDKQYLLKAFPWLLGSLGTMVEDATIFVQFRLYADGLRIGGAREP